MIELGLLWLVIELGLLWLGLIKRLLHFYAAVSFIEFFSILLSKDDGGQWLSLKFTLFY